MVLCNTCRHKSEEEDKISLTCLPCCYEYGCLSEEDGLDMDYPKKSMYEKEDSKE